MPKGVYKRSAVVKEKVVANLPRRHSSLKEALEASIEKESKTSKLDVVAYLKARQAYHLDRVEKINRILSDVIEERQ